MGIGSRLARNICTSKDPRSKELSMSLDFFLIDWKALCCVVCNYKAEGVWKEAIVLYGRTLQWQPGAGGVRSLAVLWVCAVPDNAACP